MHSYKRSLFIDVNPDIEMNTDIPDKINSIHTEPINLTRMLGIYLDNAIEACLETGTGHG